MEAEGKGGLFAGRGRNRFCPVPSAPEGHGDEQNEHRGKRHAHSQKARHGGKVDVARAGKEEDQRHLIGEEILVEPEVEGDEQVFRRQGQFRRQFVQGQGKGADGGKRSEEEVGRKTGKEGHKVGEAPPQASNSGMSASLMSCVA